MYIFPHKKCLVRRIELFLFSLLFAPSIVLATPQPGDEEASPPSPSRKVEMEGFSPAAAPAETDAGQNDLQKALEDFLAGRSNTNANTSLMSSPAGSVASSISSVTSSRYGSPNTRDLRNALRSLKRKKNLLLGVASASSTPDTSDDEGGDASNDVRGMNVIAEEDPATPRTSTSIDGAGEEDDQAPEQALEEWVKTLPSDLDLAQLEELTKTLQKKLKMLEEQARLEISDRSILLTPDGTPNSKGNSRDQSCPGQEIVSSGPIAYMDGEIEHGDGYPPNGDEEGYDAALLNKKQSINGEEEGTKKCCCTVQ